MLHHRTNASKLAAVVTFAFLAGCSTSQDWTKASPENAGYQWRGQGDPTNFGSTYDFCRNTIGSDTSAQRLQGGAGPLTTMTGGPNIIPGDKSANPQPRGTAANRRQFNECMASQGWMASEPVQDSPQVF